MVKTKKSLAEQLADLSTTTPKDYDPEDIGGDTFNSKYDGDSDMGSDDEGDVKEHAGREHYIPVGKSQLRSKTFLMDDPKYKGKKSSRKAALGMESEDEEEEEDEDEDDEDEEEDQDEDMVSDNDDLDDGEDLMADFERGDSEDDENEDEDEDEDEEQDDDSQDEDDDDEEEDSDDGEDDDDSYGDLTASGITETSQEMQEELQKIQNEEKDLLKSMTKSVSDDVEKGIHVKAQMSLWETLLDTRIRLQKSVALINTFPQPAAYDEFLTNESAEPLEESKHNLRSFIDTLITVRTGLLRNLPEVKVPKSNKRQLSDLDEDEEARNLDDDAWQSRAWKDIEALDDSWRSYRNNTLEKWSNKVQVASGIPLNKKFKAMNQGIMTQISQTMADKERLLKRTQLKRSEYHILGAAPEAKEDGGEDEAEKTPQVNKLDAHLSNHDEEIFDDADFYQQLLRELIESRMVDNDDPTAMGMRWAALRQTKQTKKQVDTKGSKGRRLRYHVHEKLQSFMAPIPAGTWHEEMVEELFSSLLGRKGGSLNDEEEEEEAQAEEEKEEFEDDGLRIFG
ncbi:apoptosis-antagonizing transcription factor [Dissophora ornata]|nr:hypothetical protein BGZ58_001756 [Dissophora ornata]KAI8602802.1 apoptosis-antagonizing transcription factor [Dissophora ornata]